MALSDHPEPTATLTLEVDREHETSSDVAFLFEALDGLVVPSLWTAIALAAGEHDSALRSARAALIRSVAADAAGDRFFPGFRRRPSVPDDHHFGTPPIAVPGNGFSVLDYGVQVGLNAWVRRTIRDEEPDAYAELTRFVRYRRIQHESPLLIEAVIFGGATAATALIKAIGVVYDTRSKRAAALKGEADAEIRQVQAEEAPDREAEVTREQRARTREAIARARQAEAAAQTQEALAAALGDIAPEHLRERVIAEAAKAMAPAVEALVDAPLEQLELRPRSDRPLEP